MSLVLLKMEVEKLCYDIQDEIPEGIVDRIMVTYKRAIHDPVWIEKNAHMRIKVCGALSTAMTKCKMNDHEEANWQVNVAQGALEEAVRIDVEERQRGIPKPLLTRKNSDPIIEWLDESGIEPDEEGFVPSSEIYDVFENWVSENYPDDELPSSNAFGRRLTQEGFEKTSKKINGKAVKGWKLRFN